MPRVEQFICDQCGAVKQETNHWWVSRKQNGQSILQFFPIEKFSPNKTYPGKQRFLCGEKCCVKELSEFLQRSTTVDTTNATTPRAL